jgi:hypothetical protein
MEELKINNLDVVRIDDDIYFIVNINPIHPNIIKASKYDTESGKVSMPVSKWIVGKNVKKIEDSSLIKKITDLCNRFVTQEEELEAEE